MLHFGEDFLVARRARLFNVPGTRILRDHLPDRSAAIVYWGRTDFVGPLLFDHDLLVIDPSRDDGATLLQIADAADRAGRPLFVMRGLPMPMLQALATVYEFEPVTPDGTLFRLRRLPLV